MEQDNYETPDNGFSALVQEMRGGMLQEELDAEVKKMTDMIRTRGGSGKIQLTFTIKQVAEYENTYTVDDAVKVTHPKPKKKAELRFRDKDGGLVSYMPEQEQMFPAGSVSDKKPSTTKPTSKQISPIK